MSPTRILLLATFTLGGCSRTVTTYSARDNSSFESAEAAINQVVSAALEAEAAGRPTDTLFVPKPIVVVNGRTRTIPPLFAAIAPGGVVAVTSSQLEIRQGLAWSLVDYRWEATGYNLVREGQATLILSMQQDGHWRISHAHSSSPR